MKRALLTLTILVCATAEAQRLDATAPLKEYAAKVLPSCPGGTLEMEPIPGGPAGFNTYGVTLRSTDQYCGVKKYLLHSPKTQQILIGAVVQLPQDARPTNVRIAEQSKKLLNKEVRATIAPFPLPDGLKTVSITRDTPYGPFTLHGFLDRSEKFMVVGHRGSLTADPAKALREALGASKAPRRGNASAKAEVIELSDFQCPTCAHAHKLVEPLIEKNLSKINYIRIDLPLFETHEWAVDAAMGARAMQRVAPTRYWHYVDYVFKNQSEIAKRKFDDVIRHYAEDNDLDWAALQKVYASKAERQALLDQLGRAFSLGLASTPTFIVNGQVMGFGPDGTFTMNAIKSAIGK